MLTYIAHTLGFDPAAKRCTSGSLKIRNETPSPKVREVIVARMMKDASCPEVGSGPPSVGPDHRLQRHRQDRRDQGDDHQFHPGLKKLVPPPARRPICCPALISFSVDDRNA
jgi:hypothetical protein